MGHRSIESKEYLDREFPEGCLARNIQFFEDWIEDAFNAGYSAALCGENNTVSQKFPELKEVYEHCRNSVTDKKLDKTNEHMISTAWAFIERKLLA